MADASSIWQIAGVHRIPDGSILSNDLNRLSEDHRIEHTELHRTYSLTRLLKDLSNQFIERF